MPRLAPDQIVDICLAGGWRRTVRVDGVGDAHVDVTPVEGPPALPAGIELWEATIEWRAERGLARLDGVLTAATGSLRFLETGGEVVMQRRRSFRVSCAARVTIAGSAHGPVLTEAVDLSVGGMLLARADSLSVGDQVRFAVTLGEGEILVGGGRVVRGTPFGHRALSFQDLTASQEQRLGRFIAELQRQALREGPARESRPPGG
jgi:PilZ domain-containing protein